MKRNNILIISIIALIILSICSIFLYSYYSAESSTEKEIKRDMEYDEISLNIELGLDSYFWATNSDAKTLKELIKEHEGKEFFETSEKDGEFKIESYKNVTPDKGQEWIFILEDCESASNSCIVEDFEDLRITEDLNFFVIMGEKDKLEF